MGAYEIAGIDAASLADSIESGVVVGALCPGDTLPSVRELARRSQLSPTTVANAYRELRQRGIVVTHDRSRTVVAHRPPLAVRLAPQMPEGVVDLTTGNPDPGLLPALGPALTAVPTEHRLYGDDVIADELAALARAAFDRDGVASDHLAVVGGGLDGIERLLEVHCRPGDRVAVEDPGYAGTLDLVRALGLIPVPVRIDEAGMLPEALGDALEQGVVAVLHVSRSQNPTGAALTSARAHALRQVLADHPEPLVLDDDHAGRLAGTAYRGVAEARERWAVVRSAANSLGPDLRIAVLVGDDHTVTRVRGRQRLGTGWVSSILQATTVQMWTSAERDGVFTRAIETYRERRSRLLDALSAWGIEATGVSGLNVWVPVAEEAPVVQGMMTRGWALQPGEPYRIESSPAVRITISTLAPEQAADLAQDLATVLGTQLGTRRG